MSSFARFLLIAIGALAAIATALPAMAARSTIRVIVNGDIITSYDISQRAKMLPLFGVKGGEKKATEELIEDTLKVQEAGKRGMAIPAAQVDRLFASMAQDRKMSAAQMTRELGKIGIATNSMKKWIKAQMTWRQLVQTLVRQEGQIKSSDIMAAMLEKGDVDGLTQTEFRLQKIIFVVPEGSSSNYAAQRRREAESYRQRFSGCDNSLAQAKSLKGVVVQDLGRRETSQLRGPQGKQVLETPVGRTTRPSQSDKGVELIAVCSKRDFKSDAAARAEVETQLRLEQAQDLREDFLKKIRDAAIIQYR